MANKTTLQRLRLDPYFSKTIATNLNVWSHDQNSYEIKFEFYDHQCDKPIDLTGADMRILLDHQGNQPKIYPLEIESKVLGLAKFIMPEQIRGCEGKFTAHIYADYPNKTHDFGSFTFYTQLSRIDGDLGGCMDEIYVSEFETALEKFKEIEDKIERNDLVTMPDLKEYTHTKMYIDDNLNSLSNRSEQLGLEKANKSDVLTKKETNDALDSKADKQKTENALNNLERKKADQSFVDAQLSSIVSGAPKGTYKTLQALKEAYPNGTEGVFLVLEDGHWYYYEKEWTDGGLYQQTEISTENKKNIGGGLYLDYNETALAKGFNSFVIDFYEQGSLSWENGNKIPEKKSIRSSEKRPLPTKMICFNKNEVNYRYRFFEYNSDGSFVKNTPWFTKDGYTHTFKEDKLYLIEIQTPNFYEINKQLALENVRFSDVKNIYKNTEYYDKQLSKYAYGTYVDKNKSPEIVGFNAFLDVDLEKGSISSENGHEIDTDVTSMRSKLFYSDRNITIFNKNTKYFRVKFVVYDKNGNFKDSGYWITNNRDTFRMKENEKYRIQISTYGSVINIEDITNDLKFVYEDDKIDNLEPYWRNHINEKVKTARSKINQNDKCDIFLVTTDTHRTPDNINETNKFVAKKIIDDLNIRTMVHLGDLIAENKDKNVAINNMVKVMSDYNSITDDFYVIRGNHDDNNEGHRYPYSSCITQSESYQYMFKRIPNHVAMGKTGTYYYFDDDFMQTRYIFLDGIDFPYQEGSDGMIKEKHLAWGIEQLRWLAESLKAPNGFKIIIFNHFPVVDTFVTQEIGEASLQTKSINNDALIKMLEIHEKKESAKVTVDLKNVTEHVYFNGEINLDYTGNESEVIAFFSGHEHIDDVQTIPGTRIRNVITLNNSENFSSNIPSHKYQPERKMFDITEEVYDVVIINHTKRKIDLVRFGAGEDREMFF